MLIDARSIAPGEMLQCDVCIVGAGPAGITVAHEFINRSTRVLLLESGDLKFREVNQQLYEGVSTGSPYHPLHTCRHRLLGGTSNIWGGWCRPLDPIDFEQRDWVSYSGWPFSIDQIESEYKRAHVLCKLGPYNYDVGKWRDPSAQSLLPHAHSFEHTMFRINAMRFGQVYRSALQRALNVHLVLNANVLKVETDEYNRRVQCVRAATLDGNHFAVSATHFVLAAGGIENARILLASRQGRNAGVGNDNDLVGRFFADHLHITAGILRPTPDVAMSHLYQTHKIDGVPLRYGMALTEESRRDHKLLGLAITLHNADDPHDVFIISGQHQSYKSFMFLTKSLLHLELPDRCSYHITNALSGLTDVVALGYKKLMKPPNRVFIIGCRAEQTPNPDSRVSLDSRKDCFGMPMPRLDWKVAEEDLTRIGRAQMILTRELAQESVNFTPFFEPRDAGWRDKIVGGAHHIGTTRMHRDPKLGVVDETGRVHGVSNLYLAGSSVFPTSGWAPPTLTIVALSLRLAHQLQRQLQ
jgi:choline dehydrogenase-like flavoprotein